MVDQLEEMKFKSIIVLDNKSSYQPFISYLSSTTKAKVIFLKKNYGPRIPTTLFSFRLLAPKTFFYTDPDLKLNSNLLQSDYLKFLDISKEKKIAKVGVALEIESVPRAHEIFVHSNLGMTSLYEFEKQFWQVRLPSSFADQVFEATIDTTFALYNRKYKWWKNFYRAVRVGGNFTAEHLPWYSSNEIPKEEKIFYEKLARDSHFGL